MFNILIPLLIALIGSPTTAYLTTRYFNRKQTSPLLELSKRVNVFKINFIDVDVEHIKYDKEELSNFKYTVYATFNTQGDVMSEIQFVQYRQELIAGINSLKLELNDSRSHSALRDFLKECANTYPQSEFPVVLNMMSNVALTLISRIK